MPHLRIALRALRRDAGYALLNGAGLTVALACCVLIGLYARAELSFDRHYHQPDRLALVAVESRFGQDVDTSVATSYPVHLTAQSLPSVESAAMLSMGRTPSPVVLPSGEVLTADVLFGSDGLFDVLDAPVMAGDPGAALAAPDAAIVTAEAARRLFGEADPIGQAFRVETRGDTVDVAVAAVVADPPRTATTRYEVVLSDHALESQFTESDGWGMRTWQTAVRLAPGATRADFDRQFADAPAVRARTGSAEDNGLHPETHFAVPLVGYHLSDLSWRRGFSGDPRYLGLFSAAALLVLLLGLINYVNLATARAARRAREVGVRKALGAGRGAIAAQFLAEAVVLTVIAGGAALAVAALAVPAFNAGFETELAASDLDAGFVAAVLGASVLVGMLAGAYPAAVLARFDPATVLRGASSRSGRPSNNVLRRALVAVQFAVAIGLLAATASVLRQIDYASEQDLGFVADGTVAVPLTEGRGGDVPWDAAAVAFRQSAAVAAVVPANNYPGDVCCRFTVPIPGSDGAEYLSFANLEAEAGYLDVLGIDLVAGRDVAPGETATVVNETFVEAMGWTSPQDAIGQTVSLAEPFEIVGVAEDFRFESWRSQVDPAAIYEAQPRLMFDAPKTYKTVLVRFAPGQTEAGMAALREAWATLGTDKPFEPQFLDDEVAEMYASERRLAGVLGGFALVAVVVAGLGLVGLAAYTAQRRRREIGVRRALGASVPQVVALLSREYAGLLALAALVAVPLAVWGVRVWLDGFAFRAPLAPGLFAGAVALTAALALGVVGVQAWRAARVPPTRSLRTE